MAVRLGDNTRMLPLSGELRRVAARSPASAHVWFHSSVEML